MKRVSFALTVLCLSVLACAPTQSEMAGPVDALAQARLSQPVRWLGADVDKDAEVAARIDALLREPLGLKSAVEVALVRHPAVQIAWESLGLAQADLVDAGLLSNPTLNLGIGSQIEGAGAPELGFGVEWPLLSLVFLAQRTSIAEARRDAAQARVVDVAIAVAAQARRAWVMAVTTEQQRKLALNDLDAAEVTILVVRANAAAGNQTPLDLADAEAAYQVAVLQTADAERAALVAREDLHAAIGVVGITVELPTVLTPPKRPTDLENLERDAVSANLQVQAARAELDAAAKGLGYANAARFLPDLDVGVEATVGDGTVVGPTAAIAVPLFNAGQGEVLRRQRALQQRAAEVQLLAVALRARSRQAATTVDVTLRRLEQIDTQVLPRFDTIVDETARRVNGMLVFPTQLSDAQRRRFAAASLRSQALREAWIARIDVDQLRQGGTPATTMSTMSLSSSASTSSSSKGHD
jgi:cobalt-zinc-cadmium efflux system outer membrane protein